MSILIPFLLLASCIFGERDRKIHYATECPKGVLEIPDGVTAVNDSQYASCARLRCVTVPDSVISIGNSAFTQCALLETFHMGNSVQSIGSQAFFDCPILNVITIPAATTTIGTLAFAKCPSLIRVYVLSDNEHFFGTTHSLIRLDNSSLIWFSPRFEGSATVPNFVKSIEMGAFYQCDMITSVQFGNSIEIIGDSAFEACTSLTHVKIPNPVKTVGECAFSHCISLTDVEIADSVSVLDHYVFYNCTKLERLVLSKSLTYIGSYAFTYTQIEAIEIPNTVQFVGAFAFQDCRKLVSITLSTLIGSVETGTFANCESLEAISIPNTVQDIKIDAFRMCISLASANLSNSLVQIGNSSFINCGALKTIDIPDSVTVICNDAFAYCSNLSSMTLGSSLLAIGEYALESCNSLTSLTLPASLISITATSVFLCVNMEEIIVDVGNTEYSSRDGVLFSKDYRILWYFPSGKIGTYAIPDTVMAVCQRAFQSASHLESITIPESVILMEDMVFLGCSSLKSITIPKSMTYIGLGCFWECMNLKEVNVVSGNTEYAGSDGAILSYDYSTLISCPPGKTSYVVPKQVSVIDPYAFYGCYDLKTVQFEEGSALSVIDGYAFGICFSLEEVIVPDSVLYIVDYAFTGCHKLANVRLSQNLMYIGTGAFSHSEAIVSITIPKSVEYFGEEVFLNCDSIREIVWQNSPLAIPARTYCACLSVVSVVIPESVESIGDDAFHYCASLSSVILNSKLKSIGNNTFDSCSSLQSINIPNSVTYLGAWAFDSCSSLVTLEFPNQMNVIPAGVCLYCSSLTSVEIPQSVTSLEWFAFAGCESLTYIRIPSDVVSIGQWAFAGCFNLTVIEFMGTKEPDGPNDMFDQCISLRTILVPEGYNSDVFILYPPVVKGTDDIPDEDHSQRNILILVAIVCLIGLLIVEIGSYYVQKTRTFVYDNEYEYGKWENIGIYVMSVMMIGTLIVTTYIGFSVFFYCSLLCLFTPLTAGMSYVTDAGNSGVEMAHVMLWCLYAIPLIALVLTINFQMFTRFFDDYKNCFSIQVIVDYIHRQLNRNRGPLRTLTLIGLVSMCAIFVCIVVMLFVSQSDKLGWTSFIIGFISLVGPIKAFVNVPLNTWKVLWRSIFNRTARNDENNRDESTVSLYDCEINAVESPNERTDEKERLISIMDPFDIRKQHEWMEFSESESNIFVGIRQGEPMWKLIPCLCFACIAILYIVFDITASIRRINNAYSDDFTNKVDEIANILPLFRMQMTNLNYKPTDPQKMINSLKEFATSLKADPNWIIISTVIRICVSIYLLPFVISGNVVSSLLNWTKLAKHGAIRVYYLVASAIICVYFVIFLSWGIFMKTYEDKWNAFKPGYTTIDPLYETVTNSSVASMCEYKVDTWEYVELASIPMLAQLKRMDQKAFESTVGHDFFKNVDNYVYTTGEGAWNSVVLELTGFGVKNISIPTLPYIKHTIAEDGVSTEFQSMVYGFGGVTGPDQLAFVIENVVKYWFNVGMDNVIPFLSIGRSLAIDTFLNNVPGIIDDLFFGFDTKTEQRMRKELFWLAALYDGDRYLFESTDMTGANVNAFVVGHSSGGLFAKVFAATRQFSAVAFESPVFEHSKSYDILLGSRFVFGNDVGVRWTKMMNIHSTNSLYATEEESATTSAKYESPKGSIFGWIVPTNAYETFCHHAAACVRDDRYDRFCSWAVGPKTYESYFDTWERTRSVPINERYLVNLPEEMRNR